MRLLKDQAVFGREEQNEAFGGKAPLRPFFRGFGVANHKISTGARVFRRAVMGSRTRGILGRFDTGARSLNPVPRSPFRTFGAGAAVVVGWWMQLLMHVLFVAALVAPASAAAQPYCGDEGVWIQMLGTGGPELDDGRAGPSYLLWIDNRARLLVDAGPGAATGFDAAGAAFADLDAVVFTQLTAHHSADLPAFLEGARYEDRKRRLPLFGPDGRDEYPGMAAFVERLIGADGLYPHLAGLLMPRSANRPARSSLEGADASSTSAREALSWDRHHLSVTDVPALGRRRWAKFGSPNLRLAAMPVHHDGLPALAWRVDAGGYAVVFTGDFSNRKNLVAEFAAGADALVVSHALPEHMRGELRERHLIPSQIGRIAAAAGVRMVILGHRMKRTQGRESQSREAIEAAYAGPVIFANDLECWGL